MIPPAAADLEVTRRITLPGEPAGCDQGKRGRVRRLYVRLQTVELELPERAPNDGTQALAHEALTLMPREGVVAKVAAAKLSKNHVRDVDDSDKSAGVAAADKERAVLRQGHALDVGAKQGCRVGCGRPR